MERTNGPYDFKALGKDLAAGVVVYLVALPLCLGIATASGAPAIAGLIAGAIGGVIVGLLSGSHSSVSGPAAGLAAVVLMQIGALGSFRLFLLAVVIAGVVQTAIGIGRLGFVAGYFPTSVIKGLLAAIGVLLILKQIPHLLGHDADPVGDESFVQVDHETTFSELGELISHVHPGAATIGLLCLALLMIWERVPSLKKSPVPAPLIVVAIGVALQLLMTRLGSYWVIDGNHLVQVPIAETWSDLGTFVTLPDFAGRYRSDVWLAGLTIAAVASLETLLNIEAVDKLDPTKRVSPPNRELMAQGVGNIFSGLCGGLPITSVVVRSSVNLEAGARTKVSAIAHGFLIVATVVLVPVALNTIPIACLAAILLHTGFKLAHPKLFRSMHDGGASQYVPFLVTLGGIVMHDLLFGVGLGLATSLLFVMARSLKAAPHVIHEKHLGGDVIRVELGPEVTFLNRAALASTLEKIPTGSNIVLDARKSDYIDPDCLGVIKDFREEDAIARRLNVSIVGFRDHYRMPDQVDYVDWSSRDLQQSMTPDQVIEILKQGNLRFRSGRPLQRDLIRQVDATAAGQFPLAAFLGCIDSRTPIELVFDLGLGDAFTVRIAGNIASQYAIGSLEYATNCAGAKAIVVFGHSRCGAVTAAVDFFRNDRNIAEATGCEHLESLVDEIQKSIDVLKFRRPDAGDPLFKERLVDAVARANVERVVRQLSESSRTLRRRVDSGDLKIIGAFYDVRTGEVRYLGDGAPAASPIPSIVGLG
ncbi:MAG TPA: sulfate transporter [Planctomycetaceae bacterium]|nr:sulfate transporter [Planctomycetaceae bacterium]HRF02643.1 SulP family inorganic anion transporter [Pirellulaceae bacterium]